MRHIKKKNWRMQQVEQSLGEPIEEILRRKYVDENKNLYIIADEVGISYRVVLDWLKQAGIYSRDLRSSTHFNYLELPNTSITSQRYPY